MGTSLRGSRVTARRSRRAHMVEQALAAGAGGASSRTARRRSPRRRRMIGPQLGKAAHAASGTDSTEQCVSGVHRRRAVPAVHRRRSDSGKSCVPRRTGRPMRGLGASDESERSEHLRASSSTRVIVARGRRVVAAPRRCGGVVDYRRTLMVRGGGRGTRTPELARRLGGCRIKRGANLLSRRPRLQ